MLERIRTQKPGWVGVDMGEQDNLAHPINDHVEVWLCLGGFYFFIITRPIGFEMTMDEFRLTQPKLHG